MGRHTSNRIDALLLSASPLAIGSLIAAGIRNSSYLAQIVSASYLLTASDVVIQSTGSVILGGLVVLALFWLLKKSGYRGRLLMTALLVSPLLAFTSIFIGQLMLLILFQGSTGILQGIVMLVSVGVAMLTVVLVVADAIPQRWKNVFVGFYGAVFGTFMGVSVVGQSAVSVIIALAVLDLTLTRSSPEVGSLSLLDSLESDPFEYTRIESETITVGAGDFVAFSLISSHALVFYPYFVWAMSMLLALVGMYVNSVLLSHRSGMLPSIPVPGLLAVFPIIVHMSSLFYLTI
ncbi:MAG: hypothetical protein QXS20_09690 [Candidatus Thorarchaeota archaeon]